MPFTAQGKRLWLQLEMDGLKAMFKGHDYMQKHLNRTREKQAELDGLGLDYPTVSEYMDWINAGDVIGSSLAIQNRELAHYQQQLQDLSAGRIRGDVIVGKNCGGKKAAFKWLDARITELQKSIATGGFGVCTNISNYHHHLNQLKKRALEAAA